MWAHSRAEQGTETRKMTVEPDSGMHSLGGWKRIGGSSVG